MGGKTMVAPVTPEAFGYMEAGMGVKINGKNIMICEDGYLGDEIKEGTAEMVLSFPYFIREEMVAHVYTLSKNGDIFTKKIPWIDGSGVYFVKRVSIRRGKDGVLYTAYPENMIGYCEMQQDGAYSIWEVAIISQRGKLFLFRQEIWKGRCYIDKNIEIICPQLQEAWPQMAEVLKNHYDKILDSSPFAIPSLTASNPENIENHSVLLEDNVGIVTWSSLARGFQVVETNRGQAFVHYKDIFPSNGRLAYIQIGTMVIFDKLELSTRTKKGATPRFPWKAVGVRPL